jgi:nucleoside-diphosphate-sugar epimerase
MNRVDVRDIADAAVNALSQPGHAGRTYPLHGPDALTGEDVAKEWSRRLGRTVRYAGDDLEAWAREASKELPPWMVEDMRILFHYVQKKGIRASEADAALQAKGLGHPPRSFESYAAERAAAWKRRERGGQPDPKAQPLRRSPSSK